MAVVGQFGQISHFSFLDMVEVVGRFGRIWQKNTFLEILCGMVVVGRFGSVWVGLAGSVKKCVFSKPL